MNEKIEIIYHAFGGKLVGSFAMKMHVCQTLSGMTSEIIDFITQNCWFFGSMEDAWAFTFTGNDLKDHHLIFLSDELLIQDDNQIHWSIAHEIGHVMLGHRNSILVKQTKQEINRQEKEADEFAGKFVFEL